MSSDTNAGQNYEERFHELTVFVEEALVKVRNDEMPDLSQLDGRVAGLCADIEAAEPQVQSYVQPLMATMIGRLDELATALNEYQQKLQSGQG